MASKNLDPWVLAQGHLKTVLDAHSYKNWFSQTQFESYEDGILVVQVPSIFFAKWLRDHYLEVISQCAREVLSDFSDIKFVPSRELDGLSASTPASGAVFQQEAMNSQRKVKTATKYRAFNHRYTFERFVIGAGNRFAHAAAKAVVKSLGRAYNPLFLYGGTGLGKTHLMQAIGREALERDPSANVVFISSEQFTNQLIESIAKKSTKRFRTKYRKVDVLLIDDIHFIAGKEATQEEFFHTFNELFDMRKQIVISSDRGPKDIDGLEERLVSRFEWGLVTDIQPPDIETRVAILQNKAAEEGLTVSPEVIRYIGSCVTSNVRELEGALVTVLAYGKLTKQKIDIPMVEQILRDLIGSDSIKPITVEGIQRAVAEYFDVRISDLRGRSRQRQVSYPRQIAMFLCKDMVQSLTLAEIGEAFGGKDHTTVLYACQKITGEKKANEDTRNILAKLEKTVRA